MSKRETIKTTIKEAVDYWWRRVDECGLSVDWSEAETHCWRCGCQKDLQRCHIIPHSLGGKDEPANIVLLCSRCHAEGPNVTDPEIMWDWLRAYGTPFYDTFWDLMAMKEYRLIYQKSFQDEIKVIGEKAGMARDDESLKELIKINLKLSMEKAGIHYGQYYFNNATVAGIYRMALKNLAKSLGVAFPVEDQCQKEPAEVWWLR